MYIYLNDRLVPSSEAVVSVFDRGFLYGDGVYETMRAYSGVVFNAEEHMQRLAVSASLIGLALPLGAKEAERAIYETIEANGLKEAYIRLTVTRGEGPIGLDPDLARRPTVVIIATEFRPYPEEYFTEGLSLVIASTRRNLKEALDPRIKSLNFLNNILAKIEAKGAGAFEALMLNSEGVLTECTISNVFFVNGRELCTPSVDCGILEGITRGVVLELARAEGMMVKEGKFYEKDMLSASEVFLTNSTLEVAPVRSIGGREFRVGPVSARLRAAYRGRVARYIGAVHA